MSPYVSKPELVEPDEDVKLWRYMDLAKLLSMFENKGLFFTVSRIFREKYDYFEGAYPDHWLEFYFPEGVREEIQGMCDRFWVRYGINCWHINKHESDAMWKIYSSKGYGIAIQSTFERLKSSFKETDNEVFAGIVHYIDYDEEIVPFDRAIKAYFYKRKIFEHEKELRVAAAYDLEEPYIPSINGCHIKSDLNQLIENIYLSPTTPQWIKLLLEALLSKYKITAEVIQSEVIKKPKFRKEYHPKFFIIQTKS